MSLLSRIAVAGALEGRLGAAAALRRWASTRTSGHLHVQLEPLDPPNEGIFMMSFTRPEAKNAIGCQFLRELQECLANVAQERTTRCLLVRSTVPGVFCAGADLKVRPLGRVKAGAQGPQQQAGGRVPHTRLASPPPLPAAQERAGMTQQETARFVSELRAALTALEALPMPTVASIDGFALGGGAELALAADIRVCGERRPGAGEPASVLAQRRCRHGVL